MHERKLFFLCAICFMVITSVLVCCSSKPSSRQAKVDLQKRFDGLWPNTLSVVEYHKISNEEEGEKYIITYKAKVQFIKDREGCVYTCCGEVCFDKFLQGFRWTKKASQDRHIIKNGDLFELEGRSVYKKTEKGWQSEGS